MCLLLAAVSVKAAAADMYYYDRLNENGKYVYDLIRENLTNLFQNGEISVEREGLNMQDCMRAGSAFQMDHPECFWLGSGMSASYSTRSQSQHDAILPSGYGIPADLQSLLSNNLGSFSDSTQTIKIWSPESGWTDVGDMPVNVPIPDLPFSMGGDSNSTSTTWRISLDIREEWKTGGRSVESDDAETKKRVSALAAEAREKTTVYDQLLYVHDWLTKSNSSQAAQYQATGYTIPHTALSALHPDLSPDSAGYAKAFKLVCDQLQIPCVLVRGTAKYTACYGHMWNCVQMADGKWYVVDVMKDDPNSTAVVSGMENRKYFLVGSQNLDEHEDDGGLPYPELSSTNFDPKAVSTQVQASATPVPAAPVRPAEPSDWAKAEVNAAIDNGLIPQNLQSGYQNNITRLDFARLTVTLVENCTGQEAEEYLSSVGKTVSSRFEDTSDADALIANSLGIVKGRKKTTFDPNGSITRQEAATMLSRAAELLGAQANGKVKTYNDSSQFAAWAVEPISFVSSIRTPDTNKAVMGSVGSKQFAPDGTYTREQAYISVYRLYRALGG